MIAWIAAVCTLAAMWLAGKGHWQAWAIAIVAQGLWIWFAVGVGSLGLLTLEVLYLGIAIRNLLVSRAART